MLFRYHAIDRDGHEREGTVEAASKEAAVSALHLLHHWTFARGRATELGRRPSGPSTKSGVNTIAVQLHNASAASTDLSFDLELVGF